MPRAVIAFALLCVPTVTRGAEPPAHRVSGDLAIQARDILQRRCAGCHNGSANAGFSKLKLLDHKQLTAKGRPVPAPAQLLELVKDGTMPPANHTGPTATEIATLEAWVKSGTPEFPAAFDERYVLQYIADDLDREVGRTKSHYAGEHLRYASFAHLIRDGEPLPDISGLEQQLNAAVSFAAPGPEKLLPIDPAGTVFRIDLSRLGWWTRDLFDTVERQKPVSVHGLRPFDLLLLEYPHATRFAPADPHSVRLQSFLAPKNQARPVPYIRGEWLTAALANGKSITPLAADLKSLAALETAIARSTPLPDGHEAKPFASARPIVAPVPPIAAVYAGDVSPAPAPFTISVDIVVAGKPVASVKEDVPYKLRVSSDRAMRFVLLKVMTDGELRLQPVDGGEVIRAKESRELAPAGDGFVTGPETFGFVLLACEDELPAPLILRSRHPDRHVWRFLLEPTAMYPFDPNKVVRKMIPVHVSK